MCAKVPLKLSGAIGELGCKLQLGFVAKSLQVHNRQARDILANTNPLCADRLRRRLVRTGCLLPTHH